MNNLIVKVIKFLMILLVKRNGNYFEDSYYDSVEIYYKYLDKNMDRKLFIINGIIKMDLKD